MNNEHITPNESQIKGDTRKAAPFLSTLNSSQAIRAAVNGDETMMRPELFSTDSAPNPEVALQRKEMVKLLVEAVNSLDETARTLLIERDLLGYTYRELAVRHDRSVGAVEMQVSRARQSVRHYLKKNHGLGFQDLLPEKQ